MMGLIQSRKIAASVKVLTAATDNALENLMMAGESTDRLLERLNVSRRQVLDAVSADDEVEACREDLRAAMRSKPWRLYGEGLSQDDNDRLWRVVRTHLPVLIEVAITAKLAGYSVARYVYRQEEDGFLSIAQVSDKSGELERYSPQRDGTLKYLGGIGGDEIVDTHVLHLLLTHRATSTNPAGEMAAARLFAPVALRRHGFLYAAQFIQRYAQPYIVGKINANGEEEHVGFAQKLWAFVSGGAISIAREDDISLLQNSADGQAFKRLESLANARIQKLLLGKVRTSDLEIGSRAAQQTEEEAREDRIQAYLSMLSGAVQHLVDAVVAVNNVYGKTIHAPKGVWFEFVEEVKVDKARAERDKIYLDSGRLELTENYFIDILGFEKNHFMLKDSADAPAQTAAPAQLALQLAASGSGDMAADGTLKADAAAFHPLEAKLPANPSAAAILMQPKISALLSALADCHDYSAFEARLAQLDLAEGDSALIQKLMLDGSRAVVGGMDGTGRDGNTHD